MDKQFYEQMIGATEKIRTANAPLKEKRKLYDLVVETIERYETLEENKRIQLEKLTKLRESERQFREEITSLKLEATITLFNLECTARELKDKST